MMRRMFAVLALTAAIGCGGSDSSTGPQQTLKALQVTNLLVAPVTIAVDGTSQGAVQPGATNTLALASTAKTLTVTVSPFQYGDGTFVASDAPAGLFTLSATDQQLVVNNIVGTQAYFAFRVTSSAASTVYISLSVNGGTRCLGFLPSGGQQTYGYYLLTPGTEVREYTSPGCTGTYRAWTNAQISAYQVNSGFVPLLAT